MKSLRFVVVADSHIRFVDDDVATYPSNSLMVDRNRRVVELCNRIAPDFVVHLGDIVHPLPVEAAHEPTVELAGEVYAELKVPVHFVPGNHDIGDKPNALVAVPAVAEENYAVFEQHWGPAFRSFDHKNCHFAILDTPVLNSDLARESAQREWLESDLSTARDAGQRIFLFTHYPPFVRDAAEDEHYDNIGEPARSWLLERLADHQVEALFSGHVHNFLYNHHEGTDLYVVPSTGFVRPDYSELAALAPECESGRDDPAKLGIFVVDVTTEGHTINPIRTFGAVEPDSPTPDLVTAVATPGWQCPIGVTLRHGWMSDVDFPTAGLDEFRRKTVRNDAILPALWEARIRDVRIPVGDVTSPDAIARIGHLHGRGMRFTVRSAGIPDEHTIDRVAAVRLFITRWEVVVPSQDFAPTLDALRAAPGGVPVALAPLVPLGSSDSAVHHFVTSGFDPNDKQALDELMDTAALVDEFVFRVDGNEPIASAAAAARERVRAAGKSAVLNVELPRGAESVPFTDDGIVADRVEEAIRGAHRFPDVALFVDGFMDQDRGYYPRHGIIDRRYNPRPALHRVIEISAGTRP